MAESESDRGARGGRIRLGMFVRPFSDENLKRAAQVGVEDVVVPYPGPGAGALGRVRDLVERHGMRLSHVERKLPHRNLVHRSEGWEPELEAVKELLREMGEHGLEVLCYNWMPDEDWQRTTADHPVRGGARSTAFRAADAPTAANVTDADGLPSEPTPAAALWDNLAWFLDEVLPVAEDAGVKLALHPDDPPLPELRGQERIIGSVEALERVVALAPSPSNGVCLCSGSLGVFGQEVVLDGVRRLGPHIHFVHLRNVRGTADDFVETWHDDGALDLAAVVRALGDAGFSGVARPDHAPSMAGEPNDAPGYEMLGRLFAAGYLRGLFRAAGVG